MTPLGMQNVYAMILELIGYPRALIFISRRFLLLQKLPHCQQNCLFSNIFKLEFGISAPPPNQNKTEQNVFETKEGSSFTPLSELAWLDSASVISAGGTRSCKWRLGLPGLWEMFMTAII